MTKINKNKIGKNGKNNVMFGRPSIDGKYFYLSNDGKTTLITSMEYLVKAVEGDIEFVIFNEIDEPNNDEE